VAGAAEDLLRRLYVAFNDRDVEAVAASLHPDVDWPNAFEGGRVHGREGVLAYWRRQFTQIDPRVTPERFTPLGDGRIAVEVHQVVRSAAGETIADRRVAHVYVLRDGLVERMDVEER
jgi:ketosteroid isomerase-like protein